MKRPMLITLRIAALAALMPVSLMLTTAHAADDALTDIHATNNGITLHVSATSSRQILSVNVRVAGPGDLVFEKRVEGQDLEWIPEGDLPDGLYSWEAWVITVQPDARPIEPLEYDRVYHDTEVEDLEDAASSTSHADSDVVPIEQYFLTEDKRSETVSGHFRVIHGEMHEINNDEPNALSSHGQISILQRFAGALLDFIVPSAQAQTGNYSAVQIDSTDSLGPPLTYMDTSSNQWWIMRGNSDRYRIWAPNKDIAYFSSNAAPNSLYVWSASNGPRVGIGTNQPQSTLSVRSDNARISLENPADNSSWFVQNRNNSRFEIQNQTGLTGAPFTIENNAPANAIYINSAGRVGINTDAPGDTLQVGRDSGGVSAIRLQNSGTTYRLYSGQNTGFSIRQVSPTRTQFAIRPGAPSSSLYINEIGDIGFGTSSPEGSLHVERSDGSARINVVDTEDSASFQVMYALINQGNPQFRMENTATDKVWNFRTQDFGDCSASNTCFVINKRSGPRFRFMEDGDMFIEGAYENSSSKSVKHGITDLEPDELFKRLTQIGVYEWSYDHSPNTRHIGPMAEDFYAAFGLGSGERSISPSNMAGISLAAAQALHERNRDLEERLAKLESMLVR